MFRRKKTELPLSLSSSIEGSGKSIHVDAPIMRSIKQTSTCTKSSYVIVLISLFMIIGGWRKIIYNRAHLILTCHMSSCSLDVVEPNTPRSHTLISRKQIVRTDYVKLDDSTGEIVEVLQGSYRPRAGRKGKGKKYSKYFDSYTLVLKDHNTEEMGEMKEHIESFSAHAQKSLIPYNELSASAIQKIGIVRNITTGEHLCILRRYWGNHRAWANFSRLKSYVQGRRNSVTIREYRSPSVLGILLIVFGIFTMVFSLILGQFWNDNDDTRSNSHRQTVVARRKRMESQRQRKALSAQRKAKRLD